MDRPAQLEQSMWEFVYGLLPDDEALAIREQIVADPDVARLYAEVKLRSNLVAEAARLKSPPMQFPVPSVKGAATDAGQSPQPSPSTRYSATGSAATALRWAVTLAATLLVGFVGYAYLKPQSPLRPLAYQTQRQQLADLPVHAVLLGPSRLQSQPANHLAVLTKSLDGEARSTEVAYRLYGEDDRLLDEAESLTDAAGILQIKTPAAIADRFVRLEVRTPSGGDAAPLSHTFAVDPAEFITHLNLDKPLARPGQTVRFRTVTLNRYSLRADEKVTVATEIADGDGNVLAWSSTEALTEQGVRHGEFQIPGDLPEGMYRVVARSPDGQFADVSRNLAVREFAAPRFRKQLDFGRESYGPGDQVTASFSVQRAEGGAMSGAELQIQAVVDGQTILQQDASTDEQGAFEVTFALPDAIDRGEGQLLIAVGGEATEVLSERIPIQSGTFAVDFFPESGDLVAGIENRVYFRARNPQGKAVHVAGRIVDDAGRLHAEVRTERDGRGAFSLVPQLNASYRLQIDTPANAGFEPQLPSVDPGQWLVLDGGAGVFEAGSDLMIEVRSSDCSRPLAITATCRGAVVGQEIVAAKSFVTRETQPNCGHRSVLLPVAEHAQGVVRVTVYDLSAQPALPVAERLVYRRPHRKLQIQVDEWKSRFEPGEQVELWLNVQDETGQDQPAVLGVSVVDDLLLAFARDRSPGLTTHFWLTGQVGDARDLEDADFYLDPQRPEAARALDLLLGTQGWRRVRPASEGMLAARVEQADQLAAAIPLAMRSVTSEDATTPLMVADNARQVQAWADRSLATLRSTRELDLRRIGLTALAGGLIVMVAALILSLLRGIGGLRRWAPHLAAASLCAILGMFWVSAGIDPQGQLSWSHRPTSGSTNQRVGEVPGAMAVSEGPQAADRMGDAAVEDVAPLSGDAVETANGAAPYGGMAATESPAVSGDAAMDGLPMPQEPAAARDEALPFGLDRRARSETLRKSGTELAERESLVRQAEKAVGEVEEVAAADKPARQMGSEAKRFAQAASDPGGPVTAEPVTDAGPAEAAAADVAQAMAAPAAPPPGFGGRSPSPGEPLAKEASATLAAQDNRARLDRGSTAAGGIAESRTLSEPPPPMASAAGAAPRALARPTMSDDSPSEDADAETPPPAPEMPSPLARRRSDGVDPTDRLRDAQSLAAAAPSVAREYPVWSVAESAASARLAEDVDATCYWNPIAVADQRGRYRLSFKLPEHETMYRISVDGHMDGRIGSKQAEIVVRKAAP